MNLSGYSAGALLAVFAILLVMATASDIFVRDDLRPGTNYLSIIANTLLAGIGASYLIEYMGIHLLG